MIGGSSSIRLQLGLSPCSVYPSNPDWIYVADPLTASPDRGLDRVRLFWVPSANVITPLLAYSDATELLPDDAGGVLGLEIVCRSMQSGRLSLHRHHGIEAQLHACQLLVAYAFLELI